MRYQSFLRKSTYRRYGIFILTIFFSYYSIQAFINNQAIDESIKEVDINNNTIRDEIDYKNNFYKYYLEGEYAPYFLGHENGQLYRWERIVRIKQRRLQDEMEAQTWKKKEENPSLRDPKRSRQHFIENKLKDLKILWIIE